MENSPKRLCYVILNLWIWTWFRYFNRQKNIIIWNDNWYSNETGRWNSSDHGNRLYNMWMYGEIGDEFHYILQCCVIYIFLSVILLFFVFFLVFCFFLSFFFISFSLYVKLRTFCTTDSTMIFVRNIYTWNFEFRLRITIICLHISAH